MDADEDEDGVEVEGIRDESGERALAPAGDDSSSAEGSILEVSDSDESQLSEYQDRRRLRREEKDHERQGQRLGILRRSLRIEQAAFRQSIPRGAAAGGHQDLHDIMRRYDDRLARIDEKQRRHTRMAERLYDRRSLSARRARERRRQREMERRLFEAQTRAERRERRRQQEQRRVERVRRRQEEERVRVQVEQARISRAMAEEREQALREEEILTHRHRDWLASARNQGRTGQRGRRILGELDIDQYPKDGSSERVFVDFSDSPSI